MRKDRITPPAIPASVGDASYLRELLGHWATWYLFDHLVGPANPVRHPPIEATLASLGEDRVQGSPGRAAQAEPAVALAAVIGPDAGDVRKSAVDALAPPEHVEVLEDGSQARDEHRDDPAQPEVEHAVPAEDALAADGVIARPEGPIGGLAAIGADALKPPEGTGLQERLASQPVTPIAFAAYAVSLDGEHGPSTKIGAPRGEQSEPSRQPLTPASANPPAVLAESEGFEPPIPLRVLLISNLGSSPSRRELAALAWDLVDRDPQLAARVAFDLLELDEHDPAVCTRVCCNTPVAIEVRQ
jgi:hypothetical protein